MKKSSIAFFTFLWCAGLFAQALNFKASIPKSELPKFVFAGKVPEIVNLPPGSSGVSANRMCGDGDVERFKSENPGFEFVPASTEKLPAVMGLWVVKAGEDILPTKDNWVPFGYAQISLPTDSAQPIVQDGKFKHLSNAGNGEELTIPKMLASGYAALTQTRQALLKKVGDYRIFSAIMTCQQAVQNISHTETENKSYMESPKFLPASLDLNHEFLISDGIRSKAQEIVAEASSDISKLKQTIRFSIRESVDGLNESLDPSRSFLDFSGHEHNASITGSKRTFDAAKALLQLNYADYQTDEEAKVKTALGLSSLSGLLSETSLENDCSSKFHLSSSKYFWEIFPSSLASCKILKNAENLITILRTPDVLDETEFLDKRAKLAQTLYAAYMTEAIQRYIQSKKTTFKRAYATCIPESSSYIHRIVGSFPMGFKKDGSDWKLGDGELRYEFKTTHPEPLFALQPALYDSNYETVWGMQPRFRDKDQPNGVDMDKINATGVNPDENIDFGSFFTQGIDISMPIRSVGGGCVGTVYC